MAAGRELLAPGSSARFAVQLMVSDARSRDFLESWLADAGRQVDPARLYLVPASGADIPRIGVVLAPFPERNQATEALEALPENLKQFRPYVRSIDALREDVRRAPPIP
jgi:septal ring-binding cell division protein DamX